MENKQLGGDRYDNNLLKQIKTTQVIYVARFAEEE